MKVIGSSSHSGRPADVDARHQAEVAALGRERDASARAATSSTNQKPALWRVASYSGPGLPRPTSSRIMVCHYRSVGHRKKPRRRRGFGGCPRRGALLLVLLLGLLRPWSVPAQRRRTTGAGARLPRPRRPGTVADTITGFGLPWVTTLMPSASLMSLTCSDWPLVRLPRSTVRNSGSCEARHWMLQLGDDVVDEAAVGLDGRRVLLVDEVQRHLLRDLGGGVDALEVDVQHDRAERVHLVVAQQHLLGLAGEFHLEDATSGRLPSSARRRGRCDRARSWPACRRRRRCREPFAHCAGGGSLRSPAACARKR